MDELRTLPIERIAESPFNYRRTFIEQGLQELAESIKAVGLQQPIKVRILQQSDVEYSYEAVFGHRRLRACKLAGLEEVQCLVTDMTDDQVRIAQIAENLQREDVHPIEEAEGFAALMREHGVPVEQLMRDTGKSRTYIYNRLKLATLGEAAREACLQGLVNSEVATLIARLPLGLQRNALKLVEHSEWQDGENVKIAMPVRMARTRLTRDLMTEIEDAPWDLGRDDLTPGGACATCPKRSINDPGLADLGKDVCTDTPCFEARMLAHSAEKVHQHRAAGGRVIEGEEAQGLGGYGSQFRRINAAHHVRENGQYVHRTLAQALDLMKAEGADDLPEIVLVVDPMTSLASEMIDADDARKVERWLDDRARRIAGVDTGTAEAAAGDHDEDDDNEDRPQTEPLTAEEEAVANHGGWLKLHQAVLRRAAAAAARTSFDLREIALLVTYGWYEIPELIAELMGWADVDQIEEAGGAEAWLHRKIEGMTPDDLARLVTLVALDEGPHYPGHKMADLYAARLPMAAAYQVDVLQPPADDAATTADQEEAEQAAGADEHDEESEAAA